MTLLDLLLVVLVALAVVALTELGLHDLYCLTEFGQQRLER